MKPLGWLGLLVSGVILYGIGHRDGRYAAEEAQRAARRQAAQDSAFASQLLHARTVAASEKAEKERAASEVRRQALAIERASYVAAADTERTARQVLAVTLPALFDTRDTLRVTLLMLRSAEQEAAHLRSALERASREMAEMERQRDLALADRDRWRHSDSVSQAALASVSQALTAEVAANRCRLLDLGPLEVGCPSRKATAAGAVIVTTGMFLLLR